MIQRKQCAPAGSIADAGDGKIIDVVAPESNNEKRDLNMDPNEPETLTGGL